MLAFSDLILLHGNLSNLREVPYFNYKIYDYIDDLLTALNYCIENFNNTDSIIIQKVSEVIWSSYNHISDSNTKDIPYEMEYMLQSALAQFTTRKAVIITAFTNSNTSFYFLNINVIGILKNLLPDLEFSNSDTYIIQIAMPEFYSNSAIYMIPMYHELGHFIDTENGISTQMLFIALSDQRIIDDLNLPTDFHILDESVKIQILIKHFSEYFCDAFASQFIGSTITDFLIEIGASNHDSTTHPATHKRRTNIENYLNNIPTSLLGCMESAIRHRSAENLQIRFKIPDITLCLNSVETYQIKNSMELHGILPSYWNYLKKKYSSNDLTSYSRIFKFTNDLVIKSIRNFSIREKWNDADTNDQ